MIGCLWCNSPREPIHVTGHIECVDCHVVIETCCEGAPQL